MTEGHSQGFATIKEANRGVKMAQNTRGAAEHGLGNFRSLRNVWFAAKGFTAHIKRMVADEHLPQLLPQCNPVAGQGSTKLAYENKTDHP